MVLFFLLFTLAWSVPLTQKAVEDQVTKLPGQPDSYTSAMYSGYMDISHGSIFYYYVEAIENPETAPLVWWTNGGPGCSGFNGFMEEQGPFRPNKEGTLDLNPHAWNQKVNMVYVEQPIGVGFSTANNMFPQYGDDEAAMDNHEFLEKFFDTFPDLQGRPFYLASESYGGHYLPTLAKDLVDNPLSNNNNFMGFLVGNPLVNMTNVNAGEFLTLAGHQLLPKPLVDQWNKYECAIGAYPQNKQCNDLLTQFYKVEDTIDPYAIGFPLCVDQDNGISEGVRQEMYTFENFLDRSRKPKGEYFPTNYEPCLDDYTTTYMNRVDVKQAIHADPNKKWSVCSNMVGLRYPQADQNVGMESIYQYLLTHSDIKIMIYSGDNDAVCATAATQLFLWDMNWIPLTYWEPWYTNGQTSGYVTKFSNGFVFKTVHGAGHMVPATRPEQALALFEDFLFDV